MAATPKARITGFASGSWPPRTQTRSKKLSPPPGTPNSLGSCVIAMVRAAPALKPSRIVSLMKFTSEESLRSQARKLMRANTRAVSAAIFAASAMSPPDMPATVVPTSREMAEVGPTASWREEPNSA